MSGYPMVDEVNRLVANRLAGGGEVFLPGVGSLYTERRGARRVSRRRIEPPCRFVSFTSLERGVSVVDQIALAAQCDTARAQEVYDRWLASVRNGESFLIEGVGVLKFKNFTPDPAFDKVLNPQGRKIIRVKSTGADWVMWVGIAAIVVAAGIGAGAFLLHFDGLKSRNEQGVPSAGTSAGERLAIRKPLEAGGQAPEGTRPQAAAAEAEAASSARVDDGAAVISGQATSEPAVSEPMVSGSTPSGSTPSGPAQGQSAISARQDVGTPEVPAALTPGHKYVVQGVFSTPENVARAIADVVAKDPSLRCGVYRFGAKYMLSLFESTDAGACARFIRENEAKFPGMWTYTAR